MEIAFFPALIGLADSCIVRIDFVENGKLFIIEPKASFTGKVSSSTAFQYMD